MTAEEGEYRWPVSESVWVSAYERRLQRLEDNVTSLARTVIGMEKDMKEVNSSIVQLRDDTHEIRDLVRGIRVLGKISMWIGGFVGVLVSLYTLGLINK